MGKTDVARVRWCLSRDVRLQSVGRRKGCGRRIKWHRHNDYRDNESANENKRPKVRKMPAVVSVFHLLLSFGFRHEDTGGARVFVQRDYPSARSNNAYNLSIVEGEYSGSPQHSCIYKEAKVTASSSQSKWGVLGALGPQMPST